MWLIFSWLLLGAHIFLFSRMLTWLSLLISVKWNHCVTARTCPDWERALLQTCSTWPCYPLTMLHTLTALPTSVTHMIILLTWMQISNPSAPLPGASLPLRHSFGVVALPRCPLPRQRQMRDLINLFIWPGQAHMWQMRQVPFVQVAQSGGWKYWAFFSFLVCCMCLLQLTQRLNPDLNLWMSKPPWGTAWKHLHDNEYESIHAATSWQPVGILAWKKKRKGLFWNFSFGILVTFSSLFIQAVLCYCVGILVCISPSKLQLISDRSVWTASAVVDCWSDRCIHGHVSGQTC